MNDTSTSLPEYRKPPLIEVVCGVQFAEVASFRSVHFGEFWQRLRTDYPTTEDHAPLTDILEPKEPEIIEPQISTFELPPLRRVFLIHQTGSYLLQVQPTRFLSNWRKQSSDDQYPRFTEAYRRFRSGWNEFVRFIRDIDGKEPSVNQLEITYVNHIVEGTTPFPAGMKNYLSSFAWRADSCEHFLQAPKSFHSRLQFLLPRPAGVLRVTISTARRISDDKNVIVFDLTSRGPAPKGAESMEEWFPLAHEFTVRAFTDLTSEAAHKEWERTR